MEMENENRVVMGIPAEYFSPPQTIITTPEPLPCSCPKVFIVTLSLTLFLFIALAFLGVYFTDQQSRAPIIHIESIVPSNKHASPNTTNWHLTFSLKNRNKYASIFYKYIRVSVSDGDNTFFSNIVDDFYPVDREEGQMVVDVFGLTVNFKKQKTVVFTLALEAVVCFKPKYMQRHWQILKGRCGDVDVRPLMNLTLDGTGLCNVNLE